MCSLFPSERKPIKATAVGYYAHILQHDGGNQSGAVTLCASFYNDSRWRTAYGQDALYPESFEAESRASIITTT